MIWQDRTRTDPTKRKFIDENGNEQNVNIEEIQSNITQSGTPVNATTMNNIEKNLGTYGNDSYDSTATYLEGETVTHNALLYRAKQDIDTPEEWTAAHWEETSVLDELGNTSGNEVLISDDETDITRQTKIWIDTNDNIPFVNGEIAIGKTNPNNYRTWFKQGKNLANNILATQTESGITITKNSDGTIKLNGTASANVVKTIAVVNLLGGKTYTLSGGENLSTETVRLDMRMSEGGNLYNGNWYIPAVPTVTITNNVTLYLTMRIQSGVSFTNKIIYPMLEENSIATTYEAYITPEIIIDNNEIYSKPDEIFSNNTGVTLDLTNNRTFNLAKNSLDYKYIEIVYSVGNIMASTGKIPCINQGQILFNVLFLATTDTIQQRTLVVRNDGTSLYLVRASYINAQVGGGFSVNTNSGSCSIHRVILYN